LFEFGSESSAAGDHRIGVAYVHNIALIDNAVVIDVLVFGISRETGIGTVFHYYGFAVEVGHNGSPGIAGISFQSGVVNPQVTVTEEAADGCAYDDTLCVGAVS